jgi:hypothetical protein
VCAKKIVRNPVGFLVGNPSGRKHALPVPEDGNDPGFVECDPVFDAVSEGLEADARVLPEMIRAGWIEPSVGFEMEGEWKVPVVERDPGCDAMVQERIDKIGVTGSLRDSAFPVRRAESSAS